MITLYHNGVYDLVCLKSTSVYPGLAAAPSTLNKALQTTTAAVPLD